MKICGSIFRPWVALLLLAANVLPAQSVSDVTGLTAALATANANPSVPATINLAGGTYTLTASLPNLAANGLTLNGPTSGAPAILEATGLASTAVFNVTAKQVTIANITVHNARTHAIAIQPGADGGRVEDCILSNPTLPLPTKAAIDGNGCAGWSVTGNTISDIAGSAATAEPAIHFYGGASNTVVASNLILNCDRAILLGGDPMPDQPASVAPAITNQPQSLSVTAPATASFSVVATGTPAPVYQWQKNGTAIVGATAASYTTPATSISDSGALFSVVVSNSAGSVTSGNATLTVNPGTQILSYDFESDAVGQAPAKVTLLNGHFLVTASGPSGSTGKVLQDPAAAQEASPAVGRLDLWGDPTSDDQVMSWRRWPSHNTAVNVDGVVLRSQVGTTVSTASLYTGLTQGYLFLVSGQGQQLEIHKLRTGGDDTLATAALAVGSFTRYRASVIGTRLRFEHSTDGQIWTTDIDITDTTFAKATGRPLYVNGFWSWNPNSVYVDGFTLTNQIVAVVLVTSVKLDQSILTGVQGTSSQLTWSVLPTNATFPGVTFSSGDSSIATANSSGLLSFVSPGTCTITAQGTSGTPSTLLVHTTDANGKVPSMKVGINFWNKNWEADDTYFKAELLDPNHPEAWNVAGLNPWRPELLTDLAMFNGPIRFMDMNNANGSPIQHWSDRYPQNYPQFASWVNYWAKQKQSSLAKVITIDPALLAVPDVASYYTSNGVLSTTYTIGDLSYEWMIDLCNRTGRDMWINVPAFADHDFMTQLATLINTTLDPKLKVYVEYSNEYWNYISVATGYGYSEGARLGLPGGNKWYQGAAWCVYHSLEVFKAFEDVFGAANTGYGKRLIRVTAFSSDGGMLEAALRDVVYSGGPNTPFNPTWNPNGQKPDVLAIAPYIGPDDQTDGLSPHGKLDGADPQIAAKFRANVDLTITNYVLPFRTIAQNYGLPLVTYEGGQQLDTNAGAWSANPAIYAEYQHLLDQLNASGVKLFNHYTLYGDYSPGGAWGLKNKPGDPNTTVGGSPKYQAVQDWLNANP